MKLKNKKSHLFLSVMVGFFVITDSRASVSLQSLKDSAQNLLKETSKKAGSSFDSIKSSLKKSSSKVNSLWNDFSPETKTALIAALVSTGALVAAGAGYAMFGGSDDMPRSPEVEAIWNSMSSSQQKNILNAVLQGMK